MASVRSELILKLVDMVTGPSKAVGKSLGALNRQLNIFSNENLTNKSLRYAGKRFREAGRGARDFSVGITAPGGIAAWLGADAVYGYEKAGNAAQAYGRLLDEQREDLEDYIKVLNLEYPFDPKQIMEAAQELLKAGLTFEQAKAALSGALSLSLVSGGDVGNKEAADIITNILTALRMPMETGEQVEQSLTRINDALAHAATTSNTTVALLSDTFRYVAPLAAMAGMSVEEVASLSAEIAKMGIKGSEAGTAFRSGLVRLARPTKMMLQRFDALGIKMSDFVEYSRDLSSLDVENALLGIGVPLESLDEIIPDIDAILQDTKLKNAPLRMAAELTKLITDAIGDQSAVGSQAVSDALETMVMNGAQRVDLTRLLTELRKRGATATDIGYIFDVRQGSRLASLLATDLEAAVDQFVKTYKGANERMARVMVHGIVGDVMKFNASFTNLFIAIAESGVLNTFSSAIQGLTEFLIKLGEYDPDKLEALTYGIMGLVAIGPAGFALGGIAAGISSIGASIEGLSAVAVAIASPGGILAATGLVALGAWVAQNKDATVAGIRAFARAFRQSFDQETIDRVELLKKKVAELLDMNDGSGQNTLSAARFGREIGEVVGNLSRDLLHYWLVDLPDAIIGLAGKVKDVGPKIVSSIWDGMKSSWADFMAWVRSLPQQIKDAFAGLVVNIPIIGSLMGGGGSSSSAMKSGATPPPMGPGMNVLGEAERKLKARAMGGRVRAGGLYEVGEHGAELFSPGVDGYIHNSRDTARMMRGGAGGSITINVNGARDPEAVAQAISRKLEHLLGRHSQVSLEGRVFT